MEENTNPIVNDEIVDPVEPVVNEEAAHSENDQPGTGEVDQDQDTFPREYVEKLRKENAEARTRAKRTDELEQRLFAALVAADGRLADPADLPFDADLIDDPEALKVAIGNLIKTKPGLKARSFGGDIGAGSRGRANAPKADLISMIRSL